MDGVLDGLAGGGLEPAWNVRVAHEATPRPNNAGMPIRRAVRYVGRVQGVGFRATTQAASRGFAVTGFVRNEADGSVRCEVQGEAGAVEAFLAEVRRRLGRTIAGEHASPMPLVEGEPDFRIDR